MFKNQNYRHFIDSSFDRLLLLTHLNPFSHLQQLIFKFFQSIDKSLKIDVSYQSYSRVTVNFNNFKLVITYLG